MQFLRKALIPIFLFTFIIIFIGCAQNNNPNKSDENIETEAGGESVSTQNVADNDRGEVVSQAENDPSGIEWVSLEEAQKIAKRDNKKVLVFGYADWCPYCMKMRKETYIDEGLQEILYKYFVPVQLNAEVDDYVTFNGERFKSWELAQILQLTSYPTHYFIDSEGEIFGAQPGFIPKDVFGPLLGYIGQELFGKIDFEEYLKQTENIVIEP